MKSNPSWTYSRLDAFTTCPRQFYHKSVLKDVVEGETVHTIWGKEVHEALEYAVRDNVTLPTGMTQWQAIADKFRNAPGDKLLEYKFAVGRDMQPAEWGNSWSRGIADGVILNGTKALTFDWKTGKRKPTDQLSLYAAYIFAHYPEIETVATSFVWLKEGKLDNAKFDRKDLGAIWQNLMPRIVRLERAYETDEWQAKPSGLCSQWCPVLSCEFNGKRSRR
jgi:hypothetical protein